MADTNFSDPNYDDTINARLKALENAMPTDSGWITTGVTYNNGFSTASKGNDLAYRLETRPGHGAKVTVAGQVNLPAAGLTAGTNIQMGTIPRKIVPDRGSFEGEAVILGSGSTLVSLGKVSCGNDSSGNLIVSYTPTKGVTMDKIPNGWLDIYISFFAGNYGQG